KADPSYLAATIVDLAVRGYVTIITEPKKGWTVQRTDQAAHDLTSHELNVLEALFGEGNHEVSLDDLDTEAESALRQEVVEMRARPKEQGWFTGTLGKGRRRGGGARLVLFWLILIMVGISNGLVGRNTLLPIVVVAVIMLIFR